MTPHSKEELILSVNGVSLSYGEKQILHNLNLKVHNITRPGMTQGQIISICGRSGCGKTSLFKLMAGYHKPTAGNIKIDVDQHEVQLGEIGVVPQDYPLFNHRTVYDNLALALNSVKGKEKHDTIMEYCNYFELSPHITKYPVDLSGGQRQRVSILQQVLTGNKFILMDEPFSGLDSIMKEKVIELMIKVSNLHEMNTLVVVSHDIESSCAIADTVFILANHDGHGSTFVKEYDFLAEDLAYRADVKNLPRFQQIIAEIRGLI